MISDKAVGMRRELTWAKTREDWLKAVPCLAAQIKESRLLFQRVLITVDDDPIAAHAAEVGVGLARSLHAQVALIHAIDPSLIFVPETVIAAGELALRAEQDGTRLMADFRARLPAGTLALQFLPKGAPGAESVKAANGRRI
ncbi:hypothetical protein ACVOMV_23240 [Mesorhizobium atlanticum]